MANSLSLDIILSKCQSIERCVRRTREEYAAAGDNFETDFTHQDAALLNLQRACELSIDLANHLIKINKWELPASSRQTFQVLATQKVLSKELADELGKMVGLRNVVIHEYSKVNIKIVESVIHNHLDIFIQYQNHILNTIPS